MEVLRASGEGIDKSRFEEGLNSKVLRSISWCW